MYNPLDLSTKLILVTGASSGIGRATALVLSRLGARILLTGRREVALQETLVAMDEPKRHSVFAADLTDTDAIPLLVRQQVEQAGAPLDGIVHSAGVGKPMSLRMTSRAGVEAMMAINVYATLALIRSMSGKDVASPRGGSIVLMSSVAAVVASPGLVAYSGSKAALLGIAKSAALELASKRVRVNCIVPGYVKTPMLDQAEDAFVGFEQVKNKQFLGLTEADDIGVLAAYLLSDASRAVTGATLLIDGGFSTS
ncbi:MAG TPA: SDR family oxidoreductase [Candidatus Acidoferrum sp.]|jgi:NAD(P)-dependent dehydrogenase (short-subunit alcohol dehydrogenase family)